MASPPGRVRRAVEGEFWQDLVGEPAGYVLRDFGVGGVPVYGPWLDRQRDRRTVGPGNLLQVPNVDLGNALEPTFRGLLDVLAEEVPVVGQRDDRRAAYGDIRAYEEAW